MRAITTERVERMEYTHDSGHMLFGIVFILVLISHTMVERIQIYLREFHRPVLKWDGVIWTRRKLVKPPLPRSLFGGQFDQ